MQSRAWGDEAATLGYETGLQEEYKELDCVCVCARVYTYTHINVVIFCL